jgi:hypothetical protein
MKLMMKRHDLKLLDLFILAVLVGCASTKVTQQTPLMDPGRERPNQIWVYDFVASTDDVPADSSIASTVGAPSVPRQHL